MSPNPHDTTLSIRSEKVAPPQRLTFWRSVLISAVSLLVAIVIAGSLWVSVSAIVEKVKMVRGAGQIIDIVDLSRRAAETERGLGATNREDILKRLGNMGQIQVTGDSDGLKTVTNPWGGALAVFAVSPGNSLRMETVVPSRVCSRIVGLLTKNMDSLGVQQIDAKVGGESWRQIYINSSHNKLGRSEIDAGCYSDNLVVLAFTFALR